MEQTKSFTSGVVELIKTVVYALLLAGFIRTFLFQPFWIPTGSMKETLMIGDFLFVNKFAYGFSQFSCPAYKDYNVCSFADGREGRVWATEPERGDVVVFRHPVSNVDYIKRLIGLPGDTIAIKDGQIILNGDLVPQARAGTHVEKFAQQGSMGGHPSCKNIVGDGADCIKERYVETLPGRESHVVLNIRNVVADNRKETTVPEGHYFFMGDNRDNSMDSRYSQRESGVGFVPAANLIGRADRVIFSSAGRSILYFWTWRSDRYFKAVN